MRLAWGAAVDRPFALEVIALSRRVRIPDPSDTMTVMAFETGGTFSPKVKNAAGSGAIGLIQFMPSTAFLLKTSTEALSKMTAIEQLQFVEAYFAPWSGKLKTLGDIYGAVLWPGMIGKPDNTPIFREGGDRPKLYLQNKGLDANKDSQITRAEIVAKVAATKARGLLPGNFIDI